MSLCGYAWLCHAKRSVSHCRQAGFNYFRSCRYRWHRWPERTTFSRCDVLYKDGISLVERSLVSEGACFDEFRNSQFVQPRQQWSCSWLGPGQPATFGWDQCLHCVTWGKQECSEFVTPINHMRHIESDHLDDHDLCTCCFVFCLDTCIVLFCFCNSRHFSSTR